MLLMVSSGLAPFAGRGLRGLRVGLVGGTILAMWASAFGIAAFSTVFAYTFFIISLVLAFIVPLYMPIFLLKFAHIDRYLYFMLSCYRILSHYPLSINFIYLSIYRSLQDVYSFSF
jgi:hypothetical protein